jgi:hypothetical protein
MTYQPGRAIATYIQAEEIPTNNIYLINYHSSAFDFYLGDTPPEINFNKAERLAGLYGQIWIIIPAEHINKLDSYNIKYQSIKEFESYRVQALTWKFLNPATRESSLKTISLVRIAQQHR